MKKQINPTIKAQVLRSAFILLALLAVCAIPFALAQRNSVKQSKQSQKALGQSQPLTFSAGKITEERPAAQDPWHGSARVRMMPDEVLLGPVNYQAFEMPAPVPRSLLPSVNVLINNNTGFTC